MRQTKPKANSKEIEITVTAPLKRNMVVPVGEYWADLLSMDLGDPGPRGDLWRWTFTITNSDLPGTEIVGITSTTYSDYPSKCYRWARASGHPADIDFDASYIQGKPCRLVIAVDEKDDGRHRNVLDEKAVLPR